MLDKLSLETNIIIHNKYRLVFIWLGCAALAVALFFSLSVETMESVSGSPEAIARIDNGAEKLVHGSRDPVLNLIAYVTTQLGSGLVLTVVTIIFVLLLMRKKDFLQATRLLAAAIGSVALTYLLKMFFERSRPDIFFRLVEAEGYSYPSGHALAAASVYFTLAMIAHRTFEIALWQRSANYFFSVLIVAIGISRIYLGVHYFSDVIAGILLGFSWAAVLAAVCEFIKTRKKFGHVI